MLFPVLVGPTRKGTGVSFVGPQTSMLRRATARWERSKLDAFSSKKFEAVYGRQIKTAGQKQRRMLSCTGPNQKRQRLTPYVLRKPKYLVSLVVRALVPKGAWRVCCAAEKGPIGDLLLGDARHFPPKLRATILGAPRAG